MMTRKQVPLRWYILPSWGERVGSMGDREGEEEREGKLCTQWNEYLMHRQCAKLKIKGRYRKKSGKRLWRKLKRKKKTYTQTK